MDPAGRRLLAWGARQGDAILRTLVFIGPTLAADEARARLAATVLPPARQGDVWRAVQRYRPGAIGLVDGVFGGAPAVWHRELLWAMSQGVHVFGAASMGALRAAELHAFGMVGIGRIFAAYRDGQFGGFADAFEDDDEVAVEHAPAEFGYRPLCVAMVDIRTTLLAALADGAIDQTTVLRLAAAMKAIHYRQRTLAALDRLAGMALARFHTSCKQADALALLDAMAAADTTQPFEAPFAFNAPLAWRNFVAGAERCGDAADPEIAAALDQLRLDPAAWRAASVAAAGRIATRPAEPGDLRQVLSTFRLARGLGLRDDLDRWLSENRLDEAALVRLLQTTPDHIPNDPPLGALVDELRASGALGGLLRQADQSRALPAASLQGPMMDAALDWYFARLPGGHPASVEAFAASLGWGGADDFRAAVLCRFRLDVEGLA
ncbi:TfuA domain-containing protein [Acidisphaera sp. L21]|uniref:TfuA domain-containing protein n=1 Tax=Acidisphaera sp. L21 TaxID=1641851 RepID=UPI00131A8607|nr:TfuA domain-containing protein [Acidisphaera sp. L21]